MDLVMSEYHILKTGGEFDRIMLNSNFNDSLLSAHSSNKHIRINTSDSEAEKSNQGSLSPSWANENINSGSSNKLFESSSNEIRKNLIEDDMFVNDGGQKETSIKSNISELS